MKRQGIISLTLITIFLIASAALVVSYSQNSNDQPKAHVYVGIAFGGTTVDQAKLIIDRTKTYTNLFILDSGINPLSINQSAVEEICDYAIDAGLNIVVNLGTRTRENWPWQIQFYNASKEKYGERFLGAYYDDEPGGIPLDWDWPEYFTTNSTLFSGANPLDLTEVHNRLQLAEITGAKPQNYSLEAQWFNQLLERNRGHNDLKMYNITTFTSDYVLYWFDYLGGYDALFAQLGLNQTVSEDPNFVNVNQQIAISLIRGAAKMQNKDWGTIITWKYTHSPYIDTPDSIYDQMITSYNAGAKYISIFNYPYNSTTPYGILTDAHFRALETFWNQVVTKSTPTSAKAQAVLILPKDYGWGMRSLEDKIWGFWGPDDKSPLIWENTQTLLSTYGLNLDIIYDDPAFPVQGNYSQIYYWNQTT